MQEHCLRRLRHSVGHNTREVTSPNNIHPQIRVDIKTGLKIENVILHIHKPMLINTDNYSRA
ncbi:hypothetical protein YC2023_000915 [Brassica napus]